MSEPGAIMSHPLDTSIMVSHTWTVGEQQEYERMKTELIAAHAVVEAAVWVLAHEPIPQPSGAFEYWRAPYERLRAALAAYEEVSSVGK